MSKALPAAVAARCLVSKGSLIALEQPQALFAFSENMECCIVSKIKHLEESLSPFGTRARTDDKARNYKLAELPPPALGPLWPVRFNPKR